MASGVELDSTNVLRWLVVHNIRRHPHYNPPGRQFVVTAHEVYLRERAFYHMLLDLVRYLLFLALCLVLVNMRNDYNIFLRNDSVYRQIFNDPHYRNVLQQQQQQQQTRLTALCPRLPGWVGTRKTNLQAGDSEWQWHQLGHMQVCTSLQRDIHANTPPLSFFTGRMPFLPPNQQCQSTEGHTEMYYYYIICTLGTTTDKIDRRTGRHT